MADEKERLLALAREQGYLTVEDIVDGFPHAELSLGAIEELYAELEALNILIVTEEEEPEASEGEGEQGNWQLSFDGLEVDRPILSFYMREVGRYSLLSGEDEVRLAKQIERGREAKKRLAEEADFSREEMVRLHHQVAEGEGARHRLASANLRLVMGIAKRYRGQGLSYSDLTQAGNIGLMRAVDKFDWRKGNRFSTYATWWIQQSVSRAVANQSRTIRLPLHLGHRVHKVNYTAQRLHKETGREPDVEDIAEELGLSLEQVERAVRAPKYVVSVNRPIGERGGTLLEDFLEDEDLQESSDLLLDEQLSEEIRDVLAEFPDRARRIMELRYGLTDGEPRTLKEVAQEFGLSRERIRQIEKKVLQRLRHPRYSRRLKSFIR